LSKWDDAAMRSLRLNQFKVIALLFAGYAALYFCRADLSVGSPLIIDELGRHGVGHDEAVKRIGDVTSIGVFAYAVGKLFLTGLGDFWGGRTSFLIGLAGATAFTLLFSISSSILLFGVAWFGNRLVQSIAWAGLIKTSSKWFDYSSYGLVVGILSISYLVGDAAARGSMGALMAHGAGWQTLFYYAAAVAGICFVSNWLLLRESRVQAGFAEAKTNPLNLFAASEARVQGVRQLLLPLLRSRSFLIVCFLSLGCTIIRETFNAWTPVYLHDYLGYTASKAAGMSAIFPGVGAVSVLASGWLSDRLGANGRSVIMLVGLAATAAALLLLTAMPVSAAGTFLPPLAIGTVAFCLLGPYSYLGGAFALDFGGKQASAASSGIIDGVGYLGAVAAGFGAARVSVAFGWQRVFTVLAAVSVLAALAAALLCYLSSKAVREGRHLP
jgi:OPA family glycerol-3-phosphate transporter-like MFS transporter